MNPIAESLLDEMVVYATPDLVTYLEAIASMWDELESYVGLHSEQERWHVLLDPDLCPAPALPYLAQYVGETLPEGLTEAQQREWVKDAPNKIRGTFAGIALAAQRSMLGSRMVVILERTGAPGSEAHPEDWLTVITYEADTPNPDRVYYDIRTTMPADIVLVHQVEVGQVWTQVKAGYATWDAVKAHYATWDEVRTDRVGANVFSRPRPIPS